MSRKRLTHGTHNPGWMRFCERKFFGVVLSISFQTSVPVITAAFADATQHRIYKVRGTATDLCAG